VNHAKLISLVPSWTETLVLAGAHVVGRSRFCIHPHDIVKSIPAVGGTKNLNPDQLKALSPDYIILDKEENTKEMADHIPPHQRIVSHVRSIQDLTHELLNLSHILMLPKLSEYATRINFILKKAPKLIFDYKDIPGILDWWVTPSRPLSEHQIIYIIWKDPWMMISAKTFIGSMLKQIGLSVMSPIWTRTQDTDLYPKFKWDELPQNALLLFSSEPFPFGSYKNYYVTQDNPHPAAHHRWGTI